MKRVWHTLGILLKKGNPEREGKKRTRIEADCTIAVRSSRRNSVSSMELNSALEHEWQSVTPV
jgi:hypothetical protein